VSKTKRTHFNPAFWIAHWSPDYHLPNRPKARDCEVYALFCRTGSIARVKVENVHFEKGLARAVLPVEAAKMVVDREGLSEDEVSEMLAEIDAAGDLEMDFEDIFNSIEASAPYEYLTRVIASKRIGEWEEKIHIAAFLVVQHLRHPRQWNALLSWRERVMGRPRWESLARLMLPKTWREVVGTFADKISEARWTIHLSDKPAFPIGDRTMVVNDKRNRIWTPLSPAMLLEICLDQPGRPPEPCVAVQPIRKSALEHYLRLVAMQSDSIIVFTDDDPLRAIAQGFDFRNRKAVGPPNVDVDIWSSLIPIPIVRDQYGS
jgi:hypothetical protein